jgi:hypothetical protein
MLKYDPYPITINGSRKDEEIRADLAKKLEKGEITENQKIEQKIKLKPNKWDYVADPSPWAAAYEKRVSGHLAFINGNTLGRCVLNTLRAKGTYPIWIIPYDSEMIETQGEGNANVTWAPEEYVGTKAVRLAYSPEHFSYDHWGQMPGSRADEVLFHELVHVYRYASPSIKNRISDALPGYTDHEEFLAHQLSNVYRSFRGARKFNLDYADKEIASAAECEKALRSSKPLMDALALFLRIDPLAKEVAKLKTLYNPFADFARLQRP